jgi:uncharacterized protein YkwD/uncharacterized membrane protein required for colicin V production
MALSIGHFNIVDLIALVVFALYIARSWYTGLWPWVNGLLSLLLSMYFAFFGYTLFGPLLTKFFHLTTPTAYTISFVAVLVILQGVFSTLIQLFYERFPRVFYERTFTRSLAFIPAGIEGIMAIVLLVLIGTLMPVPTQASDEISSSYVGSFISKELSSINHVGNVVTAGRLDQALSLVATHSEGDEKPLTLPFRPDVTVDDPQAEQEMFAFVNQQRAAYGVAPLTLDPSLTAVARAHSQDMWNNKYFAHVDPTGKDPFDRMQAAGIFALTAGENIALAPSIDAADIGLMNSPLHKKNILNPEYHWHRRD